MTSLSVVVANVRRHPREVGGSLACLAVELEDDDQLVWADAAGIVPTGRVDQVVGASRPSRGHLYALGLEAARHPLVAFTDSVTEVQPGWRSAAVAELTAGAAVVGGPVLPRVTRSPLDAAGFFVEYGPHAASPFTSDSGDVAANNVAYRRSALEQVLAADEPLWKSVVNTRLAGRGDTPVMVDGMRALSTKRYGWGSIAPDRFSGGRLYGTQRALTWPLSRRLTWAMGCAVLPAVTYARLVRRIGADKGLRASFAASTPLVLVALSAWSAGEAWGYLTRDWNGHDVF